MKDIVRPGDSTWRIVQRGVVRGWGSAVEGRDCYVFRRNGDGATQYRTHIMPVELYWGPS